MRWAVIYVFCVLFVVLVCCQRPLGMYSYIAGLQGSRHCVHGEHYTLIFACMASMGRGHRLGRRKLKLKVIGHVQVNEKKCLCNTSKYCGVP